MDFIDLAAQQDRIKESLDARIKAVLAHGRYILGPEVTEFEMRLAEFSHARHGISCANGTDAIILPLLAWGIGLGDAVFCPSFTYCATAEAIARVGATPIFVDIERDSFNVCHKSLHRTVSHISKNTALTPKAVIAVDLFGQCADYESLMPTVHKFDLKLIADSAQGFGTTRNGNHPVNWAHAVTTSFFPAKPLGCYGDGGAILTDDDTLADMIMSLRFHGRDEQAGNHKFIGMNSRLDSLQAAILLCKLDIFADEIKDRNLIAARYNAAFSTDALSKLISTPAVADGVISTWAQYTIQIDSPDDLSEALKTANIPTARYYPLPTHKQTAYFDFPRDPNGLAVTEACAKTVISLPMHPYLSENNQDRIIDCVRKHLLQVTH